MRARDTQHDRRVRLLLAVYIHRQPPVSLGLTARHSLSSYSEPSGNPCHWQRMNIVSNKLCQQQWTRIDLSWWEDQRKVTPRGILSRFISPVSKWTSRKLADAINNHQRSTFFLPFFHLVKSRGKCWSSCLRLDAQATTQTRLSRLDLIAQSQLVVVFGVVSPIINNCIQRQRQRFN